MWEGGWTAPRAPPRLRPAPQPACKGITAPDLPGSIFGSALTCLAPAKLAASSGRSRLMPATASSVSSLTLASAFSVPAGISLARKRKFPLYLQHSSYEPTATRHQQRDTTDLIPSSPPALGSLRAPAYIVLQAIAVAPLCPRAAMFKRSAARPCNIFMRLRTEDGEPAVFKDDKDRFTSCVPKP